MSTKTITVRIGRDGRIHAETHGMTGRECLPYISRIADLTDSEVVDSWRTPEFGAERAYDAPPERQVDEERLEER